MTSDRGLLFWGHPVYNDRHDAVNCCSAIHFDSDDGGRD